MCGYTGHEFGACYPDSVCIDGFLWDADSGDEGGLTQGGDWACPRCNTARFIEDAAEEYSDGSCGASMGRPWCGAVMFERVVAKAFAENPEQTSASIATLKPFEASDWQDREAVQEGRVPWDQTIMAAISPAAILNRLQAEQGAK